MAEIVHRNLESMLPQLESLESSGIFSHNEIRVIVRRRRQHEYKLLRRPARKEDYLAAIQYEVHLDMLRKLRKKKHGIVTTKRDADNGIQNRIHGLFRRALRKFKGDLRMWMQYIEFAKRCGHKIALNKIYGRALAIHPNHPELWVMAAKFEFEELKDVSAARTLLQRGLRANSDSKHLWLEHFRLELLHVDQVRKRRSALGLLPGDVEAPVSDDFLNYKTALVVFKQATKTIPNDVEFHISFLPIVHLFEDTSDLQNEIYDSLKLSHASHPLTWDALARRPWFGVDTALLNDKQIDELEEHSWMTFMEGIDRMADGQEVRGEGSDETGMWSVCIRWCEERYQDKNVSEDVKETSLKRLLEAYHSSLSKEALSEELCKHYMDTLKTLGRKSEYLSILSQVTDLHPGSADLWLVRLESLVDCAHRDKDKRIKKKDDIKITELIREATRNVPEQDSLPLWMFWLEYLLEVHTIKNRLDRYTLHHRTERLFQNALRCGVDPVVETFSNKYLDWSNEIGGIKKARTVYKELLAQSPVPLSLYTKCIQLEKAEAAATSSDNIHRIRTLFENALRDYGSSQPDLWLEYIQTEKLFPSGDPALVGRLHWRAMKELQDQLTADFVSKYTLLQVQ